VFVSMGRLLGTVFLGPSIEKPSPCTVQRMIPKGHTSFVSHKSLWGVLLGPLEPSFWGLVRDLPRPVRGALKDPGRALARIVGG